jgi:hypothetical protein
MRGRIAASIFMFVVLGALALPGAATAQTLPTVTVTDATGGVTTIPCPPAEPTITHSQFSLTRSGDTTTALEVTIAWSDNQIEGVQPTSVDFAPGSATATVTPEFPADAPIAGSLTLTVLPGNGYQPGDPSSLTLDAVQVVVTASCPVVPPPPPPVVNPTFTG